MSTMAVTWAKMGAGIRQDGSPDHFIHTVVSRVTVTTGVASQRTAAACPSGADVAIITAVDADLLVTSGDSSVVASPTLGKDVATGNDAFLKAVAGETYIAGIER